MKGGNETEVVENGRTEFVRVLAKLRFNLLKHRVDVLKIAFEFRRGLAFEISKSQMNGDEELAGFVVDGVSDAFDLLLQRFVHPAQGGNGFLKTAMRHFIGREDLREQLIAERGQAIHAG